MQGVQSNEIHVPAIGEIWEWKSKAKVKIYQTIKKLWPEILLKCYIRKEQNSDLSLIYWIY